MNGWRFRPVAMLDVSVSWKAEIALALMQHFGSVAAMPDGEDSTGRSKAALMPPNELVDRCCAIADKAVDAFESLGWAKPLEMTIEQIAEEAGDFERVRSEASYRRARKTVESEDADSKKETVSA